MEKNYHIYAAKEAELHTAVGDVMSRWARLEYQLLELGAWGLQTPVKDAARVYSSFKTFALALDFTQAMCRARLQEATYLNSLVDLIREISGDRNFLAHNTVMAHGKGEPAEADWGEAAPKIGPSIFNLFDLAPDKREPMDAAEVSEVAQDVQFLLEETISFRVALAERPLPEKYRSRVQPRRPRLAERRDSGGKAPEHPPESSQA